MFHRLLHSALAALALAAPASVAAQTDSLVRAPASPSTPPSQPSAPRTVTIRGVVFDSVGGAPLEGAAVQLVAIDSSGRSYGAQSDSAGVFRMDGVAPGRYAVGFFHPALDVLGITSREWLLEVGTDSVLEVNLATPSPATVRDSLCKAPPGDSTAAIVGLVRDADTDIPVTGAMVYVSWYELVLGGGGIRQQRQEVPVRANAHGWYAICGLPGDAELAARAELGSRASGYVDIGVRPSGLVRADLALPSDSAAVVVADDRRPAGVEPVRRGTWGTSPFAPS